MSHLNGFEIFILFYILHDCIVTFQIEIRFFIELHGSSKLSMTSCPPSSEYFFISGHNCKRYAHSILFQEFTACIALCIQSIVCMLDCRGANKEKKNPYSQRGRGGQVRILEMLYGVFHACTRVFQYMIKIDIFHQFHIDQETFGAVYVK